MKIHHPVIALSFFMCLFFLAPIAQAHPGNTASDGCHYCHTNCESWGYEYETRHCHNGGTSSSSSSTSTYTPPPQPTTYELDGETYYSEADYNVAVAEKKFEEEHKVNISNSFEELYETEPTDEEVQYWYDYSDDIIKIEQAMMETEEYKELHESKNEPVEAEEKTTDSNNETIEEKELINRDVNQSVNTAAPQTAEVDEESNAFSWLLALIITGAIPLTYVFRKGK